MPYGDVSHYFWRISVDGVVDGPWQLGSKDEPYELDVSVVPKVPKGGNEERLSEPGERQRWLRSRALCARTCLALLCRTSSSKCPHCCFPCRSPLNHRLRHRLHPRQPLCPEGPGPLRCRCGSNGEVEVLAARCRKRSVSAATAKALPGRQRCHPAASAGRGGPQRQRHHGR